MKKVSVIIPCYNVEEYINRCADSLFAQTIGLEALELIFVNDCSTDGTLRKLLDLEKQHEDSVMVIDCAENGKNGMARNIGTQYATAPYIGYVDADDFVAPDMFETLYHSCVENDCDVAVCGYQKVTGNEMPIDFNRGEKVIDATTVHTRQELLADAKITIAVFNKLYRREFLEHNAISFPEHMRYEDTVFTYLVLAYVNRICFLDCKLYYYFQNVTGTVKGGNAASQMERILSMEFLWQELCRRDLVEPYFEEWEYLYIRKYYVETIGVILLSFSKVPYEVYTHMCEFMKQHFPCAADNRYFQEEKNEVDTMLFGTMGLSETQIEEVRCSISALK